MQKQHTNIIYHPKIVKGGEQKMTNKKEKFDIN